jgi:gas vesicle protein
VNILADQWRVRYSFREQHDMNQRHTHGENYFALGLVTGAVVGVGLAIWFAPRLASELRERVLGSAKGLATRAAERYEEASSRTGEAVGVLTRKAQDVRDDIAGAVARGGREVERFAMAAKSGNGYQS